MGLPSWEIVRLEWGSIRRATQRVDIRDWSNGHKQAEDPPDSDDARIWWTTETTLRGERGVCLYVGIFSETTQALDFSPTDAIEGKTTALQNKLKSKALTW